MAAQQLYQPDLAKIHIDGFSFHWKQASPVIIKWLRKLGHTSGTLVDLGCGGGEWLRLAANVGFDVCGIDISNTMIRTARQLVPHGRFIRGSFDQVSLPQCSVVTALGEPLNYLSSIRKIRSVYQKTFDALESGGVFIFDAREPATRDIPPRTISRVGNDWACIATIIEQGRKNQIIRDITTFRKAGNAYRRSQEIHKLHVLPRRQTLLELRSIGFRVRSYRGYGDYRLSSNQAVYVARKP